ncbi:helix-turn-helix transcriptional regulator [Sulfurimonas sp. NWX79]|uniref:helix-turn-helix transcriptional regulator n=1 Tax=Campylobacterales TaxID=213849 RepID=UPI00320486F7|nr:HNH endonuclease [Sulfurimonas phage SNW-1]
MKVSIELASNYFETTQKNLYSNPKYSKYISKAMFDMDRYIADQNKNMYLEDYDEDDLEVDEAQTQSSYIPYQDREPLTASFIMKEYWCRQKTTYEIAKELNVPNHWVLKEIKRLGLGKKERGISHKSGRKGMVMSQEQRKKRQNQPHAKPVVQICPKTFITVKEYSSQGAVERYGFNRENVRRAIKTCGLHKGYLWAFRELKEATIRAAKKREDSIKRKIQAHEYKRPTKKQLEKLYIIQNKTLEECADFLKCNKTTVAVLAGKYGLKKRTQKVSIDELRHLRVEMRLSIQEIAQKLGYTPKTIGTYLSRAGIRREK